MPRNRQPSDPAGADHDGRSSDTRSGDSPFTNRRVEDDEVAVPLQQLLTVATLTPAQAALLARDLVGGLDALHRLQPNGSDGSSDPSGGGGSRKSTGLPRPRRSKNGASGVEIDAESIRLTSSGQVRFEPLWNGSGASTTGSASALLSKLIASAQQGGPARQEAVTRLVRLEDSEADVTQLAARVEDVADELLDGNRPQRIRQVRRGLGALAVATRSLEPGSWSEERPASTVPPPAAHVFSSGGPRFPRGGGRVPRRVLFHRRRRGGRWKILLIVLLAAGLLAAGWWAGPRLWDAARDGWDDLFGSSSQDPPSAQIEPVSAPPTPKEAKNDEPADDDGGPADVERSAPKSAGAVDGVSLEGDAGDCEAGASCVVRVTVDLESDSSAQDVSWSFQIVNRCKDDVDTQPGATVTAEGGWTEVWGTSQVEIPKGSALAVMAVTDSPAEASSSPMLIPEDDATC